MYDFKWMWASAWVWKLVDNFWLWLSLPTMNFRSNSSHRAGVIRTFSQAGLKWPAHWQSLLPSSWQRHLIACSTPLLIKGSNSQKMLVYPFFFFFNDTMVWLLSVIPKFHSFKEQTFITSVSLSQESGHSWSGSHSLGVCHGVGCHMRVVFRSTHVVG